MFARWLIDKPMACPRSLSLVKARTGGMDQITGRRFGGRGAAIFLLALGLLVWPASGKAQTRTDDCSDLFAAKLYTVALTACQAQAEAKDAAAQFTLGLMYYFGQGTVQDEAKAFFWFKKAAKAGHLGAQNNVGYFYFNGKAVPQDYVRAYVWFSLSAASGYTEAARFRDMAASKLTPELRVQGQAMATACTNSKFEMCE